MAAIVDIYTRAVHRHLRPLHANWEPGTPVKLGDYGIFEGRVFSHRGNIADRGIEFEVRKDPTKDRKLFVSKGAAEVKLRAKGALANAGGINVKAALEINFSKEDSAFFNAAGCTYNMVKDKPALGRQIMEKDQNHDWKREWVIVTDIIDAGSTIVAVSGGASSAVVFEATGVGKTATDNRMTFLATRRVSVFQPFLQNRSFACAQDDSQIEVLSGPQGTVF